MWQYPRVGRGNAVARVLDGGGLAEITNWLWLLIGFDVVFLVVAYLLFDLILEEV